MTNPKALLALGVLVCGCYNWVPTEMPASTGPLSGNPHYVHVARADGAVVTLRDPVMSADSLAGYTYIRGQGDIRLAIPKTDITSLSTSTFSGTKTFGAVVGAAAAALALLYIALSHSSISPACTPAVC